MAFSFDPTTTIGRVRLLIPDRVAAEAIFSDAEIEAFLSVEGDSVKRAAALGLEVVASDEAYVQKAIHLGDLWTDGAKTANALMDRAKLLREQAAQDDPAELAAFDVASYAFDPFGTSEIITNGWLRRG
jgi:hypothetical protein